MDQVHLAIGVASVVAMIVLLANSVSCISGRVSDQTSANISNLVTRGGPVVDQLTSAEGEQPILEGDYINATCSAVQSIGSKACAVIGPHLPRLPSLRKPSEEDKDVATKKEPEHQDDTLTWADPPGEE
ncbi:uncharacterized protein LOC110187474 [Drosophila serrata]|uniref:uncharacterized protein LOC110187474 n=1 Tax=Drosophila serrata TaxID=7274 RepID=UPI000A1D32B7|nr:uncharacterized protein LOC110187474 [Drosophila serrata]